MSRVRVHSFTISLDGYGAGPDQSLHTPLGKGGEALHRWFIPTRTFQQMHQGFDERVDQSDGATGVDDDFAARGFENIGAWILGRNMFGPVRGEWPDDGWKGWWGDNPPYHCPVFVLTHHARAPVAMAGGTTFHFVTEGIEAALDRARQAAGSADIRIGGGVSTVRQYLKAGLIDELNIEISPLLLGSGEHLLRDLDLLDLGYQLTRHATAPDVMHLVIERMR